MSVVFRFYKTQEDNMRPLLNASIGQLVPSSKEYYDKTGPMNGIKSAREKANITGVQKLKKYKYRL